MTAPTPRPLHAADRATKAFLTQGSRRLIVGYALATAGIAAIVAILLPFRDDLTPLSAGFAFLGVVVLTVAVGGLWPGSWRSTSSSSPRSGPSGSAGIKTSWCCSPRSASPS